MTAKEYLSRARTLQNAIDIKIDQLKRLREKVSFLKSPTISDMPKSTGGYDWTKAVDMLVDLEGQYQREIGAMMREWMEIKDAIAMVDDARYRDLLEARYINGWSWAEIAAQFGCTERNVYRMHGLALLAVVVPGKYRGSGKG